MSAVLKKAVKLNHSLTPVLYVNNMAADDLVVQRTRGLNQYRDVILLV